MASIAASRPTSETIQRITKEGRKLTYVLTCIQQPERARACGSGAKSSADRRPVDPPPVVELRIFEGEDHERQDITFSYEANFFLFATLEIARPIARGRVQPVTTSQVPVLTGMPVSGMAYLDRPKEAGYFIFPDLSVRHEGKYCLSFNLYEETKRTEDMDVESATQDIKSKIAAPGSPDSSFDWRLEVKSSPFTVFSAKKFPGLAESTPLSRTVAEQGCRVRIRRDVRMRRREGKGEDLDEIADDEYGRASRPVSQDEAYARQRSLSGSPADSQRQPYPQERRNSGEYAPQLYQDYTPSPIAPHSAPPGGNLAFGSSSYGQQYQAPPPPPPPPAPQSQYAPPPPNQAQQQPIPPQQQYPPPPPAQYHQPPYHSASQYHQGPPPQQAPYGYAERPPYNQQAPPQPQYPTQREYEPEYRRSSVGYAPPPAPPSAQYPPVESYTRKPPSNTYRGYPGHPHSPPLSGHVNLAPLKMAPIEPKYPELTSPAGPPSAVNRFAPPLPSPSYDRSPDRPPQYQPYTPLPASEPPRNGNKRSFDNVFGASSSEQPLYNGMRPPNIHESNSYDDDDEMSLEQLKMQYKRADGSNYSRELPTLD